MAKVEMRVMGFKCERCNHQWIPRSKEQPRICPKCKSPYWDRPRKVPMSAAKRGARKK